MPQPWEQDEEVYYRLKYELELLEARRAEGAAPKEKWIPKSNMHRRVAIHPVTRILARGPSVAYHVRHCPRHAKPQSCQPSLHVIVQPFTCH